MRFRPALAALCLLPLSTPAWADFVMPSLRDDAPPEPGFTMQSLRDDPPVQSAAGAPPVPASPLSQLAPSAGNTPPVQPTYAVPAAPDNTPRPQPAPTMESSRNDAPPPPPPTSNMQSLRASDDSVWIAGGETLFDYKEKIPSPYLPDSEYAWLHSLAAGTSYLAPNNLYLAADGSITFGHAAYKGAFFDDPSTAAYASTKEHMDNANGKVGYAFAAGGSSLLIPFAEGGWRHWDRNIGGEEVEVYQHYEVMVGLLMQTAPFNWLNLSFYAAGGGTILPTMQTSGLTYHIATKGVGTLGTRAGVNLTDRLELFTTLDYYRFHYGLSDVKEEAVEPDSQTNEATGRVGVAYHF